MRRSSRSVSRRVRSMWAAGDHEYTTKRRMPTFLWHTFQRSGPLVEEHQAQHAMLAFALHGANGGTAVHMPVTGIRRVSSVSKAQPSGARSNFDSLRRILSHRAIRASKLAFLSVPGFALNVRRKRFLAARAIRQSCTDPGDESHSSAHAGAAVGPIRHGGLGEST